MYNLANSTPMQETYVHLARGIYYGSLSLDGAVWEILPGQIDDIDYNIYQVLTKQTRVDILAELNKRFNRVYIPGVVEWVRI